ncbi:LacI family DNA-binding transcriptional regulator [Sphingomonas nostoxanthinifaciens]|uniref:LacI family DNA-binding transcriptional regulator n=1 Tax=Sphingomonas nostoxanthinifaciens TaxID=2872652 RepID=UPI001CC213F8|nr:LacI family DNA-binding transcriptional regulator [Sphingomonas nostoxanthinifaciens]UAK25803.1 LacI family DNA-binding transcriptional regulator [Sphingomonas nostoxanthinifaciens]
MIPTIKDVAARAGVSPKTVSRVINGELHVRQSLRDIVMRAVDELGYRPNAFARSLSSARSYLLGIFCEDPASGYAISMQRGALARCRQRNYHLLVEPADLSTTNWQQDLTATISSLHLDGAILAPPISQSGAMITLLDSLQVPHVCIAPDPEVRVRSATVEIDERQAASDMTRHLIGLGHRRIGFIEGDPRHYGSAARKAGFIAAMRDHGLTIDPGHIQPGDFSFRAGVEAGERLLGLQPRPTAIFASNDDMALGVSVAAVKHNVPVPTALSIAGFDDASSAQVAWPPITTIRQPVEKMGAAAIDILVDPRYRSRDDRVGLSVSLGYELIERESTAPSKD